MSWCVRTHPTNYQQDMAHRLSTLVGENSVLVKLLSPERKDGILSAMQGTLQTQLDSQRAIILQEFSLDQKDSALSRLVAEVTKNHTDMNSTIEQKLEAIVAEFSFDKADSALSRMVRNLEASQAQMSKEFSLDNPASAFTRLHTMLHETQGSINQSLSLDDKSSPLARLRQELLILLLENSKENREFQENVKALLASKDAAQDAKIALEKQVREGARSN